jgi:hypothetical protein
VHKERREAKIGWPFFILFAQAETDRQRPARRDGESSDG